MEKEAQMEAVERLAKGHYPEDPEDSHGWSHIQDVLSRAKDLKGSELTPEERAACLYHDSSLSTGDRETHETDSAEIARRELAPYFRKRQIERIAHAIARHRASYKGRRYTFLDDLVASADRNDPDPEAMMLRSAHYGLEHGLDRKAAILHALEHIPEKYGRDGYAFRRVPELYKRHNAEKLDAFWKRLSSMTYDDVDRIL